MTREDYKTLKAGVIAIRKMGYSYKEIQNMLNVSISKSTISLWCRDVPLNDEQRLRLYTKQIEILSRGPQSSKERRKKEIATILKKAEKEISLPLDLETFRLFGSALYWAEGSKTNSFEVTNSDPHFILLMVRWFEKIFRVPPQDLKAHLNIYPQQSDSELKQFWSQLTEIPLENFGKSFIKPPNKGYKKNNLYYGTIKIRVPRGTDLRHRVFGWIKAVLEDIEPQTKLVQKEWKSLRETSRAVNLPQS